jgi:lipoyl(octanoyl) transferase
MKDKTATEFISLGRIGYREAWDYQEKLFGENLKNKAAGLPTHNYLIFCEHDHVYTLGKSGSENNLLVNNKQLQERGVTFFKTNRGGDITYHGPGQLVGYPILDLENFGLGVKSYIDKLEKSIILTLESFGLKGLQFPGATGVWLDVDLPGKTRKICAIGVKASRHITMHGFAFNVNTDLKFFEMINPCGFTDKAVTSLEKELGERQDFEEVSGVVKASLAKMFRLSFSNDHLSDNPSND